MAEVDGGEGGPWRESPVMVDYFSPVIVPLLKHLGLNSKRVMRDFRELVGNNAASKMGNLSTEQLPQEFARIRPEYKIGELTIKSRDPGAAGVRVRRLRPVARHCRNVRVRLPIEGSFSGP